ncbi:putative N-acetyltransferase [Trypanosoma grayi]|uniref:putative N-acetyltransferase n=1 Tax=Trypanosoma grayi TaxID=71804 RepID=UPI0004F42D14|nr:putative N-acetyltransferase [Trypanosoma grayi]KEG10681.1 putative N-acetyltransferase [Trypanosoma grayi]
MSGSFVSVPPRLFRLLGGESIIIRRLADRSISGVEWGEVRKQLLASNAQLVPGVFDVANDPSTSEIFLAIKDMNSAESRIIGFAVANTSFIPERRVVIVSWIYVQSRFRGLYVGRSLLQYVESFCRENDVKEMEAMRADDCTGLFKQYGFCSVCNSAVFKGKAMQKNVPRHCVAPVPPCVASGAVRLRYAKPEDKKQWTFCMLEACGYNFGGCDMVQRVLGGDLRISALDGKDSRIVAVLSMESSGWISFVSCVKEYRGKGLGSFLLSLAMEWLRRRGGNSVSLTPLNKGVIAFYRRWSFRVESAVGEKRRRSSDSHTILTRMLSPKESCLPDGYSLEDFLSPETPPHKESDKHESGDSNDATAAVNQQIAV